MNAAALAACLLAGVIAEAVPAGASHCDDDMVILSGRAHSAEETVPVEPKVNVNGACLVLGEAAGDTRLITPASDEILVRFTRDFGSSVPSITANLNGLGFSNRLITLNRVTTQAGDRVYESGELAIDPAQQGCVSVALTAAYGGAAVGSTAFHTYDASC